jgi:hypothetical protein
MILIANEPFNRRERVKILSRPDSILQVIEGMKPPKSIPKNMAAVVPHLRCWLPRDDRGECRRRC